MPGNQTFNAATPLQQTVLLQASDGTTITHLIGPQAGRWRIDHIFVTNSDPVAHVMKLGHWDNATLFPILCTTIPANAGHGGVDAVDLAQVPPVSGQDVFQFPQSTEIRVQLEVALAANQVITLFALGALT